MKDQINPDAVKTIKERYGYDMEENGYYNKMTSEIPEPDIVIFMGCNISCPNIPSQYSENWRLQDLSGMGKEAFEYTLREIQNKMKRLEEKLNHSD